MRISRLFTPSVFLASPVLLSFVVWAIPGSGTQLRGFAVRSDLSFGAVIVLLGWYAACVLVILLGGVAGRVLPQPKRVMNIENSLGFERRFYFILSLVAAIGFFGACYMIATSVSIIDALRTAQANELSAVLLEGTNIGTLRYAVIVAAPVGVFMALQRKAGWSLAAFNVILLLAGALLSSRLSLLMALTIFAALYVYSKPNMRIKIVWALSGAALLYGLLTVYNYSRNANYYRLFGVDNPLAMNFYQIASYFAAPAQVSVGVAHGIFSRQFFVQTDPVSALQAITPTFLQSVKGSRSAAIDPSFYGNQVDIAPNLNANSTFADTYARYGWWGLIYTLIILAVAAVIYAQLFKHREVLAAGVAAGAISFGFLEYWRGFFFNQGVFLFILLLTLCAGIAAAVLTSRSDRAQNAPHADGDSESEDVRLSGFDRVKERGVYPTRLRRFASREPVVPEDHREVEA